MSLDYDGKRQRQWPSTSRMASECGPMRPHGHGLDQGPGQRSSSFELFMAPHLSTYRISCSTLPIFRRDAVWSPPLIDFQSSRRPPVAMCYCRRSVVCYCRPSTLEQSTCWSASSLTTFRRKLKTHLFRQSYPDIVL